MSYLRKIDNYLDSLKTGKNAAVDSWLLMSGPMPTAAILCFYLLFVLRLGPAIMRKRPPMKLTKTIILYNAAQVVLSAVVCYKCLRLDLFSNGILFAGCSYPGTTQDMQLSDCGWWYFFAKVTELLDTVFFVLRKKQRQISFLHVYHHTVITAFAWSYLKFAAGGQGAVLGLMNSTVHVVMYTYYLLAALGPAIEKYLWWKKYVTTMQMTQFVLMVCYCVSTYVTPMCNFPKSFTYFITPNIILFFALFLRFYVRNYRASKSKPESEVKNAFKNGSAINDTDNELLNGNAKSNGSTKVNGVIKANGNVNVNGNVKSLNKHAESQRNEDFASEGNLGNGKSFLKLNGNTAYENGYDPLFERKHK